MKIIFSKNLSEISDVDIEIIDFDDAPINENSLYSLAYEGGKYSRYKRDENFSNSMFKKFYQHWIKNSINRSFADKIFTLKKMIKF